MLWGEVLVKHPLSKGQPWIIDTMLWGEVLVNTPTARDNPGSLTRCYGARSSGNTSHS